jgi:hypothetical protein
LIQINARRKWRATLANARSGGASWQARNHHSHNPRNLRTETSAFIRKGG